MQDKLEFFNSLKGSNIFCLNIVSHPHDYVRNISIYRFSHQNNSLQTMPTIKKALKFSEKRGFFPARQLHNTTMRKQKRKVKEMKNTLIILTAVFLSLVAVNFTFAQSTAGTSAPITVSIIRALTIQNVAGNLGFQEVIMNGTSQTVSKTNSNGVTYSNPTSITSGSTLPLVNDNGTGELNVWVGGAITVSANQPAGDYVGTFSISVNY